MVKFYNDEVDRFTSRPSSLADVDVEDFVSGDATKISWNRSLRNDLRRGRKHALGEDVFQRSLYRPFQRQWLCFDRRLINDVALMPRFFPSTDADNKVIMLKQGWKGDGQLALMVNMIPEMQTDGGTQCFPRYVYEEVTQQRDNELGFGRASAAQTRRDAVTDAGLAHFSAAYPGEHITKDDLFYYVYGLLHSADYRGRFADNLSKQLPRIPVVKQAVHFRAFVNAGRRLGDLHCDFDAAEPYPVSFPRGDTGLAPPADPESFYRVEKMRFAGKRPHLDKSTVIYNPNITITGIPLEAYEYVVNGKSAIDWVMERQCVKTDKASGIVNNANRFAIETMNDPAYPLKLLQRVITVSLETIKIVRELPKLDID